MKYEDLRLEVIRLENVDIVTASGQDPDIPVPLPDWTPEP